MRSRRLERAEGTNLLAHQLKYERAVVESVRRFASVPASARREAEVYLDRLEALVQLTWPPSDGESQATTGGGGQRICRRHAEPRGTLWGFGYSYLEDHLQKRDLASPGTRQSLQ